MDILVVPKAWKSGTMRENCILMSCSSLSLLRGLVSAYLVYSLSADMQTQKQAASSQLRWKYVETLPSDQLKIYVCTFETLVHPCCSRRSINSFCTPAENLVHALENYYFTVICRQGPRGERRSADQSQI
jgi:hypothetical protein